MIAKCIGENGSENWLHFVSVEKNMKLLLPVIVGENWELYAEWRKPCWIWRNLKRAVGLLCRFCVPKSWSDLLWCLLHSDRSDSCQVWFSCLTRIFLACLSLYWHDVMCSSFACRLWAEGPWHWAVVSSMPRLLWAEQVVSPLPRLSTWLTSALSCPILISTVPCLFSFDLDFQSLHGKIWSVVELDVQHALFYITACTSDIWSPYLWDIQLEFSTASHFNIVKEPVVPEEAKAVEEIDFKEPCRSSINVLFSACQGHLNKVTEGAIGTQQAKISACFQPGRSLVGKQIKSLTLTTRGIFQIQWRKAGWYPESTLPPSPQSASDAIHIIQPHRQPLLLLNKNPIKIP